MGEVKVAAEQRLNDSGTAADEQEFHVHVVFLVEIFLLLNPDGQMVPGGPRVAGAEFRRLGAGVLGGKQMDARGECQDDDYDYEPWFNRHSPQYLWSQVKRRHTGGRGVKPGGRRHPDEQLR